MVTSSQRKQ